VLCTASDQKIADAIASHLGVFDEAIGSDGQVNLAGERKAQMLEQRFGKAGFDYAGNSSADIAVWQRARRAIVVNASPAVARAAQSAATVERSFEAPAVGVSEWRRMLRVHQWLKNLLLFVPLFAAHQLSHINAWQSLLLAFVAFSLCASAVYIANDLLDLDSDRAHPRKRTRPFAAGTVPLWWGAVLAPLLLGASWLAALAVGVAFGRWLLIYFALTCAYSWGLKRLVIVDCLTLAMLYALRIFAGAAAAALSLSFWLLAFSVFLFLSLAFVKRYAELQLQVIHHPTHTQQKVHGRGYFVSDAPLVQMLGVTAGFSAALVLALYLNSEAVLQLYRAPQWVWGAVPILLFWISWMWLQAHRGRMHDDPLVFAVKDKSSWLAGAAFAAVLAVGSSGIRW
jgi:4-hydroxybenzoate polyprenyltransferase